MNVFTSITGQTRSTARIYTHTVQIKSTHTGRQATLSFHGTEVAAARAAKAAAKWAEDVSVAPVVTDPAPVVRAEGPKPVSARMRSLVAEELNLPTEAVSDRVVRNWMADQAR